MSGVAIIRALLVANSALTAEVPASKIMAGEIPLGTALPAIGIAEISGIERNTLSMAETKKLATDRIQVSVMAKTYPSQKAILKLIIAACPNTRGTINTFLCDSIIPDTKGPDIPDSQAKIYFQSQDFIVKFQR